MSIRQFKDELEFITQVILPNNFDILTVEWMMGGGNLDTLYVSVIQPLILLMRVPPAQSKAVPPIPPTLLRQL